MQIKKFTPQDHKIKVLIYGAAKSGKTTFGGTAPGLIFASAEAGLLSVAEKKPDFVDIKSLKDLTDFYLFLARGEHCYETVIIDSITEINDIIKTEIEKRTGRIMQIQDWGELSKKILDLLRKFRDLPMHVIFIALEKYITDEDKIKKIVPNIDGKAATGIAAFMDVVAYVNVENDGTRWIETESNKKLLTGDRSGVISNDTPMDFNEWIKKVSKIKIEKQAEAKEILLPVEKTEEQKLKETEFQPRAEVADKPSKPKEDAAKRFVKAFNALVKAEGWVNKVAEKNWNAMTGGVEPNKLDLVVLIKYAQTMEKKVKEYDEKF